MSEKTNELTIQNVLARCPKKEIKIIFIDSESLLEREPICKICGFKLTGWDEHFKGWYCQNKHCCEEGIVQVIEKL